MEKVKEYAFVIDRNGNPLSPTDINNAWKLIRTKRAKCIKYNPFTIKLKKEISDKEKDHSIFHIGIRVKAIQKVTMEQRQDVKHLMDVRCGYRRNRRSEKRSRKCRYERASLYKEGRIAPTIKQKRQAVLRVVKFYQRRLNITSITLEDVNFDIRVLTEGKKLYGQEYTKSNRQDANICNAVYIRDHGNVNYVVNIRTMNQWRFITSILEEWVVQIVFIMRFYYVTLAMQHTKFQNKEKK